MLLGATIVSAEPGESVKVELDPTEFSQIESDLDDLEGDLGDAMCGGISDEDENLTEEHIKIFDGEGPYPLPGRTSDPFGHIDLGMGERIDEEGLLDDGYLYPKRADADGWTTACSPGNPPYYRDSSAMTPCKKPEECGRVCEAISRYHKPLWSCPQPGSPIPKACWGHCGFHGTQGAFNSLLNGVHTNDGNVLYKTHTDGKTTMLQGSLHICRVVLLLYRCACYSA
jgi:hypothetical protein